MRNPYFLTLITTFSLILAFVSNAQAADRKNAIIVKAGAFSLSETSQTLGSSSATFEEDSDTAFGIEYSRRFGNNFTFGGEFTTYSNDYATTIPGEVTTYIGLANIKKYFDVAEHFQPFVGAGIGIALISVSGPFTGGAGGLAAGFSAGFEIPFDRVGFHLEYKYLSAKADGETLFGQTIEFDVGGSGVFAGVAIHF